MSARDLFSCRSLWPRVLGIAGLVAALAACERSTPAPTPDTTPTGAESAASPASGAASAPAAPTVAVSRHPPGDPVSGRKLAEQFECHRCHGGTDLEPLDATRHCFGCHQDVMANKFKHKPDNERWRKNVAHLQFAPSLAALSARYRTDWVVDFLLDPHDVRPRLVPSMPRLAMEPAQARDIVAYLASLQPERAKPPPAIPSLEGGDVVAGRKVIETKGCGNCHLFTGVPALPDRAGMTEGSGATYEAVVLAADLRYTRDKLDPEQLARWLSDPLAILPNTKMPRWALTDTELRDLVAYLLRAELAPPEPHPVPARLPVLTRPVGFAEVNEKVLAVTCRHCHSDPDVALGDGGPGNTGGFGFKARKLNLTEYRHVNAGYVDDDGERKSVFAETRDGTPRLLASLLARQSEEAGKPDPDVRGMPLGLPSLTPEQIQLVETWIAQGRKR